MNINSVVLLFFIVNSAIDILFFEITSITESVLPSFTPVNSTLEIKTYKIKLYSAFDGNINRYLVLAASVLVSSLLISTHLLLSYLYILTSVIPFPFVYSQ